MKKTIIILMVATAILTAAKYTMAANGSIWNDASDNLFSDRKALSLGDIVTIIVNEKTTAVQSSSTAISQQEKLNSGTGSGILGQFFEGFGIESTDKYNTDGKTSSGSNLTTTITAEVVEVLPNSNLVVEARRSLVVNQETQIMVLSGVIRPTDVSRTNRVDSTRIANLQLKYNGKGSIAKRQKPGILNKIFDMIF